MTSRRTYCRLSLASLAGIVLIAAAPIHAAHGHDESAPSATMHAACAICQMPAPVGTSAAETVAIVESDAFLSFVSAPTEAFQPAPRDDTDACRAPPFLLAF